MTPKKSMMARARASSLGLALLPLLIGGAVGAQEPVDSAEGPVPALTHVRHVSDTFRGTPENRGLLPTAVAEAEIAHQHATLAARDPADLAAVQRHTRHVLHALDPSAVEAGPGLGYGAVRGAERTAHYIALAAVSVGASDAIETHSTHIETAAGHAMANGEAAADVARRILDSFGPPDGGEEADSAAAPDTAATRETAEEADSTAAAEEADSAAAEEPEAAPEPVDYAALLGELVTLTDAMLNGVDANGDGRIGWQEGEGGLAQATQHLGLLRRAEGLTGS